jgi:hypothetical protein
MNGLWREEGTASLVCWVEVVGRLQEFVVYFYTFLKSDHDADRTDGGLFLDGIHRRITDW